MIPRHKRILGKHHVRRKEVTRDAATMDGYRCKSWWQPLLLGQIKCQRGSRGTHTACTSHGEAAKGWEAWQMWLFEGEKENGKFCLFCCQGTRPLYKQIAIYVHKILCRGTWMIMNDHEWSCQEHGGTWRISRDRKNSIIPFISKSWAFTDDHAWHG